MRPDLDGKDWPVPLNLDPRYTGSPQMARLYAARWEGLVEEGYVMCKDLAIRGSGPAIPPGESAITSLAMGDGLVFGATSGTRAHVFAYCAVSGRDAVLDLAVLDGHTAIRNALAWLPGLGVFAGTAAPGRAAQGCAGYPGGEVLRIDMPPLIGSIVQEWNPPTASVESVCVPVAGEGVACMIGDPARGRLYGLSDESGMLFSVDAATGETTGHGDADELRRFSPHLILGPDGLVYGTGTRGRVFRFDPDAGTLNDAGMDLPYMAGRGQYSRLGAWAMDPRTGLIYAGDVADGLLSELDVRTGRTRALGKPTAQPHVRALAVVPDGRVYGVAGKPGTIGHLFCCDPAAGELRDLGVMASAVDRRSYAYEADCAAAGPDGRVYFGETERVSHLFVYFPPMQSVRPGEA